MRLLVTRPEPDGERTAEKLRALGHTVMLAPLLRVEAVRADLEGAWDALALTSVNAMRAMADDPALERLQACPVYAVGGRTADAAFAQGFANVVSADGDLSDLVRMMKAQLPAGTRVLYLAGEDRSGDLAAELAPAGIVVATRVVYRAVAVSELSADVRDALAAQRIDGVLHYSRRTAAIYVAGAQAADIAAEALAPAHHCLSRQVAEPLAVAGARHILVADEPTEAALIASIRPI
jgi:uroporphyrinogen-III synthase